MQQLILNILASDIEETEYTDSSDCAITRALARAGRSDLKDSGICIMYKDGAGNFVHRISNDSYAELASKVGSMYYNVLTPEDFTHIIEY